MKDELFDEKNEVKIEYNTIKFGKVGDWFKGTLVGNTRQMANVLSATKEMQTVFEFKTISGSFHNIVDRVPVAEVTEPIVGDVYSYISGKQAILNQMKDAKIGQIVGLKYTETKPASQPGYAATKIIKVYLGEMDAEYKAEREGNDF